MSSRRLRNQTLAAITFAALFFLYLPLAIIVLNSFNSAPHGGPWREFTTQWYARLWHDPAVLSAAKTTIILAAASTLIATLLGTLLALGLSGGNFPGKRAVAAGMLMPVVIPDIVMAVALLLLFRQVRDHFAWLEPGLLTMTLAHVTFQIPFVAIVVRARLAGFDHTLEEAARDLGASRWQSFWRVKFPLIRPGILAGALLAITLSLDDFVVSFFTTGPGATTLPILIYSSVKRGITPEINAVSSLFILAAVAGTLVLACLQRDRSTQSDNPSI